MLAEAVMETKDESKLSQYKFTKQEKEWLKSIKEYHSYFVLELAIDNTIKRVYLMDASKAPELTQEDKDKYNFERRVNDDGVEKVKLNLKAFKKFWDKHLTVGFNGMYGVEYVKHKRHEKIYRCRPFGWVIADFQG